MDKHWSESTGEWYYVCSVGDHWDYISHDVEDEDLTDNVAGMFILRRDGSATPAPTTRAAWEFLANMDESDWREGEEDAVCVGKVVDGMCVPIGNLPDLP